MPESIKILFLAAEAEPFVKIGGLGDVSGSLPRAIQNLSMIETSGIKPDVRLVLPLHKLIVRTGFHSIGRIKIKRGAGTIPAEVYETNLEGCPVYFIDGDPIQSSESVYSTDSKLDGEKYSFFSMAALELPELIQWTPDILHANDWHSSLALYASHGSHGSAPNRKPARVITVHNLAYLGPNLHELLIGYGINPVPTNLPGWSGEIPLPLGLWAADAITTVSPSFAQQMLEPETGGGLRGFLRSRESTLFGILNGLDTKSYNPSTDAALETPFDIARINDRHKNKISLQAQLGLTADMDIPLFGVVSRMDRQKGVDLVLRAMKAIKKQEWQMVILGTGDPTLEQQALELEKQLPEKVRILTRFDEVMARRIYAGADCLLMPSRYEPCGLAQMIAMRYGCVPLVRATGGLKDTVTHLETGIVFDKPTVKALTETARSALKLYKEKTIWTQLQKNAMQQDFSWSRSALKYFNLYKDLYNRTRV